jgi:hypothetical protein
MPGLTRSPQEVKFSMVSFLNIPYLYRGRSIEGCDCWGLIYLVRSAASLPAKTYDGFYELCPTADSISLKTGLKYIRREGFRRTKKPSLFSVALGLTGDSFCLGILTCDGVLATSEESRSTLYSWEEWKGLFDRAVFYEFPDSKS